MKKLYFLSVIIAFAFVVTACTPQQQEEAADILANDDTMMEDDDKVMEDGEKMEDDGTSMQVPVSGEDGDEMMVEDGESMGQDDSMMDDGDAMEQALQIEISGKNFEFNQKEIRVKKGQKVKIVFTSESGLHDWAVDEFSVATARVRDGQTATIEFTADKKGTFEYYCSVGSHRALGMVGSLIVE